MTTTSRTISAHLDADLASGQVLRIIRSITRNDKTAAIVRNADGTVWAYFDQNTLLNTGEVCRQLPGYTILDQFEVNRIFD